MLEHTKSFVTRDQFDGRCQVVDERFGRDKERLDAQEKAMQQIRDLTVQMGEILKKYDSSIEAHEKRITTLEKQPADQYGKIKAAFISAVVSGGVVYVISLLTAK